MHRAHHAAVLQGVKAQVAFSNTIFNIIVVLGDEFLAAASEDDTFHLIHGCEADCIAALNLQSLIDDDRAYRMPGA